MPYSRECPDCGANLDPGERCDCQGSISIVQDGNVISQPVKHTSDCLILGVDTGNISDISMISVARYNGNSYDLLREITGQEAEQLYDFLIGKAGTIVI
jgi:hypothetical protein